MHNREKAEYEGNFMDEVIADLEESVGIAIAAGVAHDNIWLDPGIGFVRNAIQNIWTMQGLDRDF